MIPPVKTQERSYSTQVETARVECSTWLSHSTSQNSPFKTEYFQPPCSKEQVSSCEMTKFIQETIDGIDLPTWLSDMKESSFKFLRVPQSSISKVYYEAMFRFGYGYDPKHRGPSIWPNLIIQLGQGRSHQGKMSNAASVAGSRWRIDSSVVHQLLVLVYYVEWKSRAHDNYNNGMGWDRRLDWNVS